ncbi:MAG: HpcH/HpaI aldolase family protein [Planctomycetota bacterium]|jgi:4-hydroxy-2-oxoheptanedioate aldolase
MDGKELAEALHSGKRIYGTLIISTSPKWVEVMRDLDIDCVFIDTEHIPLDWQKLGWMCHTFRGLGMAPIVRIPRPDPFEACRVLDMGAVGVVAAYMETAEQVNQLRSALKLRPLKGKRLEEVLSGKRKLEGDLAKHVAKKNEGQVLLVNIESVPAIEALDEILAVPGVDGLMVGPSDLSCSLGVPLQFDHPLFAEAMQTIIDKARARNVGVGCHNLPRVDQEVKWGKAGLNMILRRADMTLFRRALDEDLSKIREALGDKPVQEEGREVTL